MLILKINFFPKSEIVKLQSKHLAQELMSRNCFDILIIWTCDLKLEKTSINLTLEKNINQFDIRKKHPSQPFTIFFV